MSDGIASAEIRCGQCGMLAQHKLGCSWRGLKLVPQGLESRGAQSRPAASPPSAEPSRDRAAWSRIQDLKTKSGDFVVILPLDGPPIVRLMEGELRGPVGTFVHLLPPVHWVNGQLLPASPVTSDLSLNVQPEPSEPSRDAGQEDGPPDCLNCGYPVSCPCGNARIASRVPESTVLAQAAGAGLGVYGDLVDASEGLRDWCDKHMGGNEHVRCLVEAYDAAWQALPRSPATEKP